MREQGIKVGLISPNVLRPFPAEEIVKACKNLKALVVGVADYYGSDGGAMAHEVKAALKDDPENQTLVISRIYGLGGQDFYPAGAEAFINLALEAARTGREKPFDYHGVTPGREDAPVPQGLPPIKREEATGRRG